MQEMFVGLLNSMINENGTNTDGLDGVNVGVSSFGNRLKQFAEPTVARGTILKAMDRALTVRQLGTYTHFIFEDLINRKDDLVASGDIEADGSGLNVVVITDGVPFVFWNKRQMRHQLRKNGINPQGKTTRVAAGRALFSHFIEKFHQVYPEANVYGMSPQAIDEDFKIEGFDLFYNPSADQTVDEWSQLVKLDSCQSDSTSSPTFQPSSSPTVSPTEKPTASPTSSPTKTPTSLSPTNAPTRSPVTSSPTKSPIVQVAPGFDVVCELQDFYLYQDASKSMTTRLKAQMLELFKQLTATWFDDRGILKENIDIRVSINSFGSLLQTESAIDDPISQNGNSLISKFEFVQRRKQRGTHSFLIFKNLVARRDDLIASGQVSITGKGLNVIIATDGDPFLSVNSREKVELFAEAGIPYPSPSNRLTMGSALHVYWFNQFKTMYPESQVFGFAPFKLNSEFTDNTFDLFYHPAADFTMEEWSRNLTIAACDWQGREPFIGEP